MAYPLSIEESRHDKAIGEADYMDDTQKHTLVVQVLVQQFLLFSFNILI